MADETPSCKPTHYPQQREQGTDGKSGESTARPERTPTCRKYQRGG